MSSSEVGSAITCADARMPGAEAQRKGTDIRHDWTVWVPAIPLGMHLINLWVLTKARKQEDGNVTFWAGPGESSRQTRLDLQTGQNPPGHSASTTDYKSFKLGFLFLPKHEFQAKWVASRGPKHENYVIMIYYLCTRAKECQRNGFPKKMFPLHITYSII